MQATKVIADLPVEDIDAARGFYRDFLGLSVEAFNLGWVAHFRSEDGNAYLQVVTRDETAPENPVLSVHVPHEQIEDAYDEARQAGYEIVHPLTQEEWGVRRFFVRAPDGNVVNVVAHD